MLNLLWIGAVQTGFFLSKQDLLNRIFLMRVKQGKQDVNQQGRQVFLMQLPNSWAIFSIRVFSTAPISLLSISPSTAVIQYQNHPNSTSGCGACEHGCGPYEYGRCGPYEYGSCGRDDHGGLSFHSVRYG